MRNKILYLITILYFLTIPLKLFSDDFTDLKKKVSLNKNDILVLALFKFDYCINCYINTFQSIEKIKKEINSKNNKKFVFVAYVECDRDKELKLFKKQYHWTSFTIRKNKKLCKTLNITDRKDIVVLNAKGKILSEFNFDERNLYTKLLSLIKKRKR